MPPKQRGETLIFVINVGITRPGVQTNSDFLDKAKLIVRRLIEKKTFLRPKDEIGIILMGANVTENSLQFPNIQELTPVEVPNWEQIENLMKLESTNCLGNWAEAIALAVDYIRRETTPSNTRNLILLSDFNEEDDIMSRFHADAIAKDLIEEEICLLLIGTGALDEKPKDALSAGEKLLMDVRDKVHGCYMTTEEAMADVRFYKQFPTHPTAWTCTLELGDLRIPISVYVIVIREVKTPSWKLGTNDKKNPNEGIRTVTKHTELSDRLRGTYNVEGTVNGYMYGGVLIPFSKEDEEAMLYKNCEKSYKIHSFAKREDVDLDYWYGNGSRLVVPSHESSATAFYSLVQAMLNENVVAIVRKVYNSAPNTAPRMVALFPSADTNIADKPWGLVEIELPFAEDIRVIDTKTIRSILKQLTKPQEQAIDDLLNSMMLTEDNCITDGEELFSPGTIPNPSIQHLWDTLSHRVLHPDKPLPMVDEELSKLLDTPESVKERSVKPLQTIGKLFDLQEIETENSVKSENGVGNMKKGPGKQQPKKMKDDYMKNKNSNERMDSSGMDIDTMAANI